MNPKYAFFNLAAAFALLFSVVFQSAHSVEHILSERDAPKCVHQKSQSKHQLTHQHHSESNCFVCHFNFGSFTQTEVLEFSRRDGGMHNGYSFTRSREITAFFRGSLFSHRGPPVFIA